VDKKGYLLLIIFCFSVALISGQSAYLEKGINGASLSGQGMLDPINVLSLSGRGGFSIAGIMDIGFSGNIIYPENQTEYNAALDLGIFVLKQDNGLPFSFKIDLGYGYSSVEGSGIFYRTDGHGYILGGELFTDLSFLPTIFKVRGGGIIRYRSYLYMEYTSGIGDPNSGYRENDWYFGIISGISFPSIWENTLGFELNILFNEDLKMYLEPKVVFVQPLD
jgi:hypothetical protein